MDNMQCDYSIHVSRGSSITLQLIDIDMEITPKCIFDFVAVSKNVNKITAGNLIVPKTSQYFLDL